MKKGKPLPKAVPLVIAVVVPLLVGVAGFMLLVSPKKALAKQIATQTADLQTQIDTRRAQLSSSTATPKIKYADVYRLQQALPAAIRVPDLILELDRIGADAGIQFDSITFPASTTPPLGAYTPFPVALTFNANFYTVTDLLYRLRSLVAVRNGSLDASGPLISISSVSLAPAGKKLTVSLSLNAYAYTPAPAAPTTIPVAAPTDTTSTDTTSTPTTPTDTTSASADGAP